jgi:hypothetical protein
MSTYFVTVYSEDATIIERLACLDFAEALNVCSRFYSPRTSRSVLSFTTEVINGRFSRSFAELLKPDNIAGTDEQSRLLYDRAAKQTNAFDYERGYFFLIESTAGKVEADDQS